jgi:hypothetical protein
VRQLAGVQEKSYVTLFSPEDRKRYRQVKQGKKILTFTVQYETLVEGEWRPVVRYDTAHRVVHKDMLDLKGREKKVLLAMSDLQEALLLADKDIRTNWQQYKERFLRRQ